MALVLGFVLITALLVAHWRRELAGRALQLNAEIERLTGERAKVPVTEAEEQKVEAKYERFLQAAKAISEEDKRGTWTPVLRILPMSTAAGVTVRRVSIEETSPGSRIWLLRVEGDAAGAVPRMLADSYRVAVQDALSRDFQVVEPCRLGRPGEGASPGMVNAGKGVGFMVEAKFTVKRSGGASAIDPPHP